MSYKATHGFVASRACGCVCFVSVDDTDDPALHKADKERLKKELGELLMRGCSVERLTMDETRAAARRMGYCDACRPAGEFSQQELLEKGEA